MKLFPRARAVLAAIVLTCLFLGTATAQTVKLPSGGDIYAVLERRPTELLLEHGGEYKVAAPRTPTVRNDGLTIGAYGDPSKGKPKWISSAGAAIRTPGGLDLVDGLTIRDVAFTFDGKPDAHGMFFLDVSNLTLERVEVTNFDYGISVHPYKARCKNVTVREVVVADNWPAFGKHCQGLYISGTDGVTVLDSVFDANGYKAGIAPATIYNHNVYLHGSNTNVVTRGNVFARGGSHGLQQRSGGLSEGNFFYRNPIGQSFGLVNGSKVYPGGVTGTIRGNVYVGGGDIAGSPRGTPLELGNLLAVTVEDLLILDDTSRNECAVQLEPCLRPENPADGVGIVGLTFTDVRVSRGWHRGPLRLSPAFYRSGENAKPSTNLNLRTISSAVLDSLGTPDAKVGTIPTVVYRKPHGFTVPPREVPDVDQVIGLDFLEQARKQPKGAAARAIKALRIAAGVDQPEAPAGALFAVRLFDARTDQPVGGPLDGDVTVPFVEGRTYSVVGETSGAVKSVRLAVSGAVRIEHAKPYAHAGDTAGDLTGVSLPPGTHKVVVEAFGGMNATGPSFGRVEANVTIPNPNAQALAEIARLEQELVAARAMAAEAQARVTAIEQAIASARPRLK